MTAMVLKEGGKHKVCSHGDTSDATTNSGMPGINSNCSVSSKYGEIIDYSLSWSTDVAQFENIIPTVKIIVVCQMGRMKHTKWQK